MKIKTGVKVGGIQPEMTLALMIVGPIVENYGQELVITSGADGKHSRKSRHYIGFAVDIRSRDIDPNKIHDVVSELRKGLGDEFYVAFETNHFHIQFNGSPHGA